MTDCPVFLELFSPYNGEATEESSKFLVKAGSQFNLQNSGFQTTRNILTILPNIACEIADIFWPHKSDN